MMITLNSGVITIDFTKLEHNSSAIPYVRTV